MTTRLDQTCPWRTSGIEESTLRANASKGLAYCYVRKDGLSSFGVSKSSTDSEKSFCGPSSGGLFLMSRLLEPRTSTYRSCVCQYKALSQRGRTRASRTKAMQYRH